MKKRTLNLILGTIILALLTLSQVKADDQDFLWEEDNNQITFSYYDLHFIAKAGGKVPKFQFMTTEHEFEYGIMFKSLIEYLDINEDGVFQYNETGIWKESAPGQPVYSNVLALSAIKWAFSGFDVDYVEVDGTEEVAAVHFSYTTESVKVPNYSDFNMTIVVHMYLNDQTIDGYDVLGAAEMKFDVIMNNWPWQRDDTKLAMRFDIVPMTQSHKINDTNGNNINNYLNTSGNEMKVNNNGTNIKQQYTIGDEQYQAFFAYATQAKYNISNTYQYKTINASQSSLGDGTVQTYLSFEHFDDEVIYDPSIGTYEDPVIESDTDPDTNPTDNTTETGTIEFLAISTGTIMAVAVITRKLKK